MLLLQKEWNYLDAGLKERSIVIKKLLYGFWVYILNRINVYINNRIMKDKDNLYIVYYSNLIEEVYITEDGQSAIELFELCKKLNDRLNRPFIKVLYGPVNVVYKYKIAKLMNIVFTFNASDEQRNEVYKFIADVPTKI